jgi:hypothetical protein
MRRVPFYPEQLGSSNQVGSIQWGADWFNERFGDFFCHVHAEDCYFYFDFSVSDSESVYFDTDAETETTETETTESDGTATPDPPVQEAGKGKGFDNSTANSSNNRSTYSISKTITGGSLLCSTSVSFMSNVTCLIL